MICNHTCAHELSGVWEFEVIRRNIAKYLGVVILSFFLSFLLSFFSSVFLCDGESFGFICAHELSGVRKSEVIRRDMGINLGVMMWRGLDLIVLRYVLTNSLSFFFSLRCAGIRSDSARHGYESRRANGKSFGFNCTQICAHELSFFFQACGNSK